MTAQAQLFDINQKQNNINFVSVVAPTCDNESQYFPSLPVNPKADLYFRAANKIKGQRDTKYFKQMYILGRKAADMGHWKAKLLMADIYLQRTKSYYSEFKPEQARAYIDELMGQNVPAAFYEMSQNRNNKYSGFLQSPAPASFYLYRAAQLGHPQALVDVSNIFLTVKRRKEARALLECGLKQGAGGVAAYNLALSAYLNATTHEDWMQAFQYIYFGAKTGHYDSVNHIQMMEAEYQKKNPNYYLSAEFIKRANKLGLAKDPLFWHDDPYRKSKGKRDQVKGNVNLKFPNLEKIIPLPPAKLPPWNGDISIAMSPEDARDYREDFDYDKLVREIQNTNISLKGDQLCPQTGYWQPYIVGADHELASLYINRLGAHWVKQGRRFPTQYGNMLDSVKDKIRWQWAEELNAQHQQALLSAEQIICTSGAHCPLTGVYRPVLDNRYPQAAAVNEHSGVFVVMGTNLPHFGLVDEAVESQIRWQWVSEG